MSSFGMATTSNPWVLVLDALQKKINRISYETWLKPTRFDHSQGRVLFVRVPNPEFCHIGERYGDLISEAMDDLGLEFQDVEFARGDAKVFAPAVIGDEGHGGRNRDLFDHDLGFRFGEAETKPYSEGGKGCGDECSVDFDRVFDDQEAIVRPLQQGDQDAADYTVDEDVSRHAN